MRVLVCVVCCVLLVCGCVCLHRAVEKSGNTESIDNPLHEAAKRGNLPFLVECLSNGVSPNALDKVVARGLLGWEGWSRRAGGKCVCVCVRVCVNGCESCTAPLTAASLCVRVCVSVCAPFVSVVCPCLCVRVCALCACCVSVSVCPCVRPLCLPRPQAGATPLHWAARGAHLDCAQELLKVSWRFGWRYGWRFAWG